MKIPQLTLFDWVNPGEVKGLDCDGAANDGRAVRLNHLLGRATYAGHSWHSSASVASITVSTSDSRSRLVVGEVGFDDLGGDRVQPLPRFWFPARAARDRPHAVGPLAPFVGQL